MVNPFDTGTDSGWYIIVQIFELIAWLVIRSDQFLTAAGVL